MAFTGLLGTPQSLLSQFVLGSGPSSGLLFVSATTSILVHPDASCYTIGDKPVSATTSILVHPAASGFTIGDKPVSAATSFLVHPAVAGLVGKTYSVIASSQFLLHGHGFTSGNRLVSASTAIQFYGTSSSYVSPIRLSALTSLSLSCSPRGLSVGARPVSASTVIQLSPSGDVGLTAILMVFASSSLALGTGNALVHYRVRGVSASSRIAVSAGGSEVADRVASATSSFLVNPTSVQARDLHASATTGLGLGVIDKSNSLFRAAATTHVLVASAAHAVATGTLAASGIRLVDRASAVLCLPWRRAGLSLPPGGNIPHS